MRRFRASSALSATLALFVAGSLPVSAQGLSEMGAAYGASGTLQNGTAAGRGAMGGAINNLFNASSAQINQVQGAAAGAGASSAAGSARGAGTRSSGRVRRIAKAQQRIGPDGEPLPPDPRETVAKVGKEANALYNLAQQKEKAGKLDEADKLYRQSLEMRERVWGDKDPAVIKLYMVLGALQLKRHKPDDAEGFYRRALTPQLKTYGFGSYELCENLEGMGDAMYAEKKIPDAVNYYQQVVTMKERKLGEDNKETLAADLKLANANGDSIDKAYWPDAEAVYTKSIALAEKSPANAHVLMALLDGYSKVLRKENKNAEADKVAARLQEMRPQQAPAASDKPAAGAESPSTTTPPTTKDGDKPAATTAPPATNDSGAKPVPKDTSGSAPGAQPTIASVPGSDTDAGKKKISRWNATT